MLATLKDYNCRSIIADKCNVEGGYVNDPNDRGGETNHGITVALANQYKAQLTSKFQWDGTMRNLSLDMAFWLYKTHFWDKIYGDDLLAIHPLIVDKVFDVSINTGKVPAVQMLQTYLNCANNRQKLYPDMVVDGYVGPTTLGILRTYAKIRGADGINRLLVGLLCSQGAYYQNLTIRREQSEAFYFGWVGRVTRDVGHYSRLLGLS